MSAALDAKTTGGQSGRVFAARPDLLRLEQGDALTANWSDEDDDERTALLRQLLTNSEKGVVRAWTHEGIDPDDAVHVYLQNVAGGPKLFCCVVISRERLEKMLLESDLVFEGFSLQVADVRHLTVDALRAAVEAWAERCFPDVPLCEFIIEPWCDGDSLALDLLSLETTEPISDPAGAVESFEPDPAVAEPPYEADAA
jgi:hypothetical protein